MRWSIVGLLFAASILNYIDRQTLSILAPTIKDQLQLDDRAYALVANAFLVAYTASYLLSGRLADWLGTRWSLPLFITWWSAANMLTALAYDGFSLGFCRFLLGLGEAGLWVVAPKVVSERFPSKERGLAIGLYTLGATIGATIAPLVVVALASRSNWQFAFFATGAAGLVWLVPWLWLYRKPEEDKETRRQGDKETQRPTAGGMSPCLEESASQSEWGHWREAFGRREVWGLMLARMLTDPVWYFYQFWLANYLHDVRRVPQKELGMTWVVYLAADVGCLAGGWASGLLIRRGRGPVQSRLWVMLGCAALAPLSPLVAHVPSVTMALALAMGVVLAHLAWLTNLSALVVDLVPPRTLSTTFGIVAAGSGLGGILANAALGELLAHYSYAPAFIAMAFLHPCAWLLLWRLVGPASRAGPGGPVPRAEQHLLSSQQA